MENPEWVHNFEEQLLTKTERHELQLKKAGVHLRSDSFQRVGDQFGVDAVDDRPMFVQAVREPRRVSEEGFCTIL